MSFEQEAQPNIWMTGSKRRQLWESHLPALLDSPEAAENVALDLGNLVLKTLPLYVDPASRKLVEGFLSKALLHTAFLKTFTALVIKHAAARRPPRDTAQLASWILMLLDSLQPSASAKAVTKLLETVASCLDQLLLKQAQWQWISVKFRRVVERKGLEEEALAVVKTSGSPGLLRALLQQTSNQTGAVREAALSLYCERVLAAKTAVDAGTLWAYSAFVATLQHEEFGSAVVAGVNKAIRRNPEVGLPVCARLLSDVSLDLSRHAPDLMPPLVQALRHVKDENREMASKCLKHLAKQLSQLNALAQAVEVLKNLLEGKTEGKIKSVHERSSLMGGLETMATGVGHSAPGALFASSIVAFCCEFYVGEVNEEVRIRTCQAMGSWLAKCSELPQCVLHLFPKNENAKEALKRALLKALISGLENEGLRSQAGPLMPSLVSLATRGLTVVTHRTDSLLALLAACWITATDFGTEDLMKKNNTWSSMLGDGSPFLSQSTAAKLSPEESIYLLKLVKSLLTSHMDKLEANAGSLEKASDLLVLLLLHKSKQVRQMARKTASFLCASPMFSIDFLKSLRYWLDEGSQTSIMQDADYSSDLLAHIVADAIYSITPIGIDGSVPIAAMILLFSHHPVVMNHSHSSWIWGKVKSHHEDIIEVLGRSTDMTCKIVCGPEWLGSSNASEKQAAISAISALMQNFANEACVPLRTCLQEFLDREEHDNISEVELLIFSTPEGSLSSEFHNVQVIIPGLDSNASLTSERPSHIESDSKLNADRGTTKKALKSKPSQTHTKEPSKSKRQTGVNSGGKDASERQAQMREKLLREEAMVKEKIRTIQIRLERGLLASAAMVRGNQSFCAERLDELAALMPLITSPLVGEGAAFEYAVALASCLPSEVGASCIPVACALRLIYLSTEGRSEISPQQLLEHNSVVATMKALATATRINPLPASAYAFCFPILRSILTSPTMSPLHNEALRVLSLHVTPGEILPRVETFKLLYQLLATFPVYRVEVQAPLLALCTGIMDIELSAALEGLVMESPLVRAAALQALPAAPVFASGSCPEDGDHSAILMIALHDPNDANKAAAADLWDRAGAIIPPTFVQTVVPFLASPYDDIRQAATGALVEGLGSFSDCSGEVLQLCIGMFSESASVSERLGAAEAMEACAEFFDAGGIRIALEFLLERGLADESPQVREKLVSAGVALVEKHGKEQVQELYTLLQSHLLRPPQASAELEARQDKIREGAILLLATLARHLVPEDPKVKDIIQRLLDILCTPSEGVQKAAAKCLSPLMRMLVSEQEYNARVIEQLKEQLTKRKAYGDRRGAAYGLAGVVKGLGISALKNYGLMSELKAFVEDKSDPKIREGGIQAFECLCDQLGKLFEPYVINILSLVLTCFGDTALSVREATADAARAIMRNLSAQGIKLVLPSLLKGLGDPVWRTKQGSIQLLGAMAWCAPKQLSACLPTIVPKLSEVLSDPHQKVQKAAQLALKEVGNTIRNPEIQELVPSLLDAIAQPNKFTRDCLDQLLATVFVNTIDASSLALVIPVVFRGLKDRSGEVKKRAARIMQNLCKLVNDPKDMAPYVSLLVPELQKSIVDPLPDVRAQASKALGALMGDMGQDALQNVMPWLIETLKSKGSSVERSGAAQALAEVLTVFGSSYLEELLPQLLSDCKAAVAPVREGGITLFKFLPYTMSEAFQAHLDEVLPAILDGLADENEGVRDAAMSAGRTLVDVYAESSIVHILPAVEHGLCNDNWRIRQSSVELLGSLFYKVAGTSGKIQMDGDSDDEGVAVESYSASIIHALGLEKRNDVLAKLYMARADVQYPVRTAALHVWKTVVVNTPKTLGEILPSLMDHLIKTLAHSGEDGRETAARCIGELVKKMGERILPSILPILREGAESASPETRQGVCYGLSEVLNNLSKQQLMEHLPTLLPAIQATLCDDDPSVREAAAGAFNAVFKAGAGGVVDTVIPSLLAQLQSESEHSKALEGLQVILSVRPQTLAAMVPRLLHRPILATNLKALEALSEAAGASLQSHLPAILAPVLTIGSLKTGKPLVVAAQGAARKVALSVPEDGVPVLMSELLKALEDAEKAMCAADIVKALCTEGKVDMSDHNADLIQALVPLLAADDAELMRASWEALGSVTKKIPKEMQPSFVRCLKDSIATARDIERRKATGGPILVSGFCQPTGLSPVLPIYLHGVLQGTSAELRELSAEGLGELVELTSPEMLKSSVAKITGSLIRIVGDRFPWQVKFAILNTLGLLINKASEALKAFVPQIQTTFLKCLQDPTPNVREQAAKSLGKFSRMSPRVDQLAADLCNNATKGEPSFRISYLAALTGMFKASGDRIAPQVLSRAGQEVVGMLSKLGDDENEATSIAACIGAFCIHCENDDLESILTTALAGQQQNWHVRLAHGIILAVVAQEARNRVNELGITGKFVKGIIQFSRDDKVPVKISACRAAARFVIADDKAEEGNEFVPRVMSAITLCLAPDQSSDVHHEGLAALRRMSRAHPSLLLAYFREIIPSLCYLLQSTGPIKVAAQRTAAVVLNLTEQEEAVRTYLSTDGGSTVKSVLTEPFLRRLQRTVDDGKEEEENY